MNRHLLTAGIAALAVTATPLLASNAMAKPTKSHHVKKEIKKTTTTTSTSTTPAPATPAKKPVVPAKK